LALDALIEKREKGRFGKTDSPRKARPSKSDDHIPAAVKRVVCARDGGQCTFESPNGRRCEDKGDLEFDHIVPRARGGKSTVDNLRLRCFAHNQLEAERAFGTAFMHAKRNAASSP
jgi:5-methylcytosine-specific restriction endonuclease McrA